MWRSHDFMSALSIQVGSDHVMVTWLHWVLHVSTLEQILKKAYFFLYNLTDQSKDQEMFRMAPDSLLKNIWQTIHRTTSCHTCMAFMWCHTTVRIAHVHVCDSHMTVTRLTLTLPQEHRGTAAAEPEAASSGERAQWPERGAGERDTRRTHQGEAEALSPPLFLSPLLLLVNTVL